MSARIIARYQSTLPEDDDHPYRTGAWRPTHNEWIATDLEVVGDLPDDLNGIYLRNTENPLHDSLGRYHPFDGDGMIHAIEFANGSASYRNRFVRSDGFEAELAEGRPLWAGIAEAPSRSLRDGIGARTRLKDASSTDIVVHNGLALSSHYQCGNLWAMDPRTLEQLGPVHWDKPVPPEGVSAHARVDHDTGELLFFNYSKQAPYLHYGVVDTDNRLAHYVPVELPGPRLPHDMAFTENYAILNDLPMFWDPRALAHDMHAVRFFPDLPSRFAIVPRRGGESTALMNGASVRWFEAEPTFVLHWINAWEDGDWVILDGYFQENPQPAASPDMSFDQRLFRFLDNVVIRPVPHRWRFNLRTGETREERLSDRVSEFGVVGHNRFGKPHRHVVATLPEPGRFLFNALIHTDMVTGAERIHHLPDGVFASESPIAPKDGADDEGDAYVVTFTTDLNNDRSECLVFDLADISAGPLARVRLPERICSGTHATWMPTGPSLAK